MTTLAAACFAVGITIMLYAFKGIHDHWYASSQLPDGPWPHGRFCGIASGVCLGIGLCSWLL